MGREGGKGGGDDRQQDTGKVVHLGEYIEKKRTAPSKTIPTGVASQAATEESPRSLNEMNDAQLFNYLSNLFQEKGITLHLRDVLQIKAKDFYSLVSGFSPEVRQMLLQRSFLARRLPSFWQALQYIETGVFPLHGVTIPTDTTAIGEPERKEGPAELALVPAHGIKDLCVACEKIEKTIALLVEKRLTSLLLLTDTNASASLAPVERKFLDLNTQDVEAVCTEFERIVTGSKLSDADEEFIRTSYAWLETQKKQKEKELLFKVLEVYKKDYGEKAGKSEKSIQSWQARNTMMHVYLTRNRKSYSTHELVKILQEDLKKDNTQSFLALYETLSERYRVIKKLEFLGPLPE